ncbi:RHS repeat-associated core domain-containing protein, partial [Chryseobacterium sp. JM1]|uniref:RHS repeat-associated core domain-containing protein n=1 Tax=Chryseobacterium sp. JM1 TaxID=1233950 RepID=UPI00068AC24B
PVKFEYGVNIGNDVFQFVTTTIWENNATKSNVSLPSAYAANTLYRNAIIDEDGNKTYEYKNGKGQTILLRKMISGSEYADTYYVYNEYNQLAFVIPPKAVNQAITDTLLNDLCYQYRYDGKGRLVEKKLPGKGWEYMVYDKADRLLLTQDAMMASQNKWLMTKYDMFGRVAYTGIVNNNSSSRNTLQSQMADLVIYDARHPTGFVRNGITVYYTSVYLNADTLLSVNYYDSYPQGYGFNPPFPSAIQGEPVLTETPSSDGRSTKGLPVMGMVKNIEDDSWTTNYTYYDTKGRPVGSYSINHLGGYTKTESKLDFAGVPQMTNTYHVRRPGESGITVKERFVYDHQNRLKEHYHQVDDKPEQLLAENTYNELSQLKNKKVGNNLQSIDYAYNIRGWMTDINKDQMSVPDLGGKLFSYKIKYNQKEGITQPGGSMFTGKEVKAKYNGNIAEVDWRSVESLGANPSLTPKRYGYAYDALNRLTAGYYQNPQNPYSKEHTESLTYDLNGNISKLYRTAGMENTVTAVIDDLDYTYTAGNQVSKITDNGNSAGYEGGGGEIKYDLNGNMWKMADKNISKIQYNHLNLPTQIDYGDMGIMGSYQYIYRADGTKVQKIALRSECGIMNCYGVSNISDYLDGFQYMSSATINNGGGGDTELSRSFAQETSRAMEIQAFSVEEKKTVPPTKTKDLSFFPTAEGFYDYAKDQYIYQYKDHLGNVRISFGRNSTGALEITDANDYYPFGMNHLKTGNAFFGQNTYKNYKFQEQELQETGFYSFKWRNYMPDLGRFFNIDPLAEKYPYNGTYNFSENRVIDGRELEGLEVVLVKDTEHNKPIIKTANNGQYADNANTKTIHVFAHGNPSAFYNETMKGETTINDGKDLNNVLNQGSKLWSSSESKDGFTVVLHACRTGRTTIDKNGNVKESVAETISGSKEMKGVTVIAPDERDGFTNNGKEIGPQSTNSTDKNGEYLPGTPKSEQGRQTGQFGNWNSFQNGQRTDQQPGNTKPSGQDQRSFLERLFN